MNNITRQEKDHQIAMHELMGRQVLAEFLKQKTDITLTHTSDFTKKEHWDVCLLSANSLSMITELKVNYWSSQSSGYTAGIKLNKFKHLHQLGQSEKALQNNCTPYIIYFHFNSVWMVDLNQIYKSLKNKDRKVKLVSKMEDNTTAYSTGQGMYTYANFDLQDFGQRIEYRFNYKQLRKNTLEQAKQILNPNIKWMDTKHFWLD